jgi:hypothetical protein
VAKVGTSKAGGTISQQAAVHPWLAADAHGNKQTNKQTSSRRRSLGVIPDPNDLGAVRTPTAYAYYFNIIEQFFKIVYTH